MIHPSHSSYLASLIMTLLIEKDENEELYAGNDNYVSLNLYNESFNEVSALDKINFLKEVENE